MNGKIIVASLGPGNDLMMTPQVLEAIRSADAVVGYTGYIKSIEHLIPSNARRISTGMTGEVQRAEEAFTLAAEGLRVAVVSAGDAGIYGMAPLILELHANGRWPGVTVEVLGGISALVRRSTARRSDQPRLLRHFAFRSNDIVGGDRKADRGGGFGGFRDSSL